MSAPLQEPARPADPRAPAAPPIVIQQAPQGLFGRFKSWALYTVLSISLLTNLGMYTAYNEYFQPPNAPLEKFHSGERTASQKLAVISVTGTIMPPFTDRILAQIKQAKEDDAVRGVLLVVDSPGGLVSDSHTIYHRLKELRATKPVVVSMKSMAASGGYYIAMAAGPEGKVFAEPTTWTGSIGVIIPRYELAKLADDWGIKSVPLKTGKFKDALNPFRELPDDERALWENILDQSFQQFLQVIDENRAQLTMDQVRNLATGQIYTAQDAKKNGMVDELGYEEDALAALRQLAKVESPRVVKYAHQPGVWELLNAQAEARHPAQQLSWLLESSVPRAMYLSSWAPGLVGGQ